MANIFRSKEVYKKVDKQESSYDRDVLIPVGEPFKANAEYGIYVAGEYRPPYYTDGLTILGFSSNPALIVDYTSKYEYPPADEGSFMYDFDVTGSTFDIERFQKDYEYPPADEGSFMYDFDVITTATRVEQGRWYDTLINQPEPGMQLESITSDPAVITNVV